MNVERIIVRIHPSQKMKTFIQVVSGIIRMKRRNNEKD